MSRAKIIEESENLKGERIATVQAHRGDEYIINVDKVVEALATLVSDERNEIRFGWGLQPSWYQGELKNLTRYVSDVPQGSAAPGTHSRSEGEL